MQSIGGYFELADYEATANGFPHKDGILLNTGRNAFEYILRTLGVVHRIYLPLYTCDVLLEPLIKLHIPWAYYHVDAKLEIADPIQPQDGEYIVVTNYFGLKDTYISSIIQVFGKHLIIDCAQALFSGFDNGIKAFYSVRKFVGTADGGIAYVGSDSRQIVQVYDTEKTASHDNHLLLRKCFGAEAGFKQYQGNELMLSHQPVRWMSDTTKDILEHIDYTAISNYRRINFRYLDSCLKSINLFPVHLDNSSVPMIYPLLIENGKGLRNKLIDNKIYIAHYWAEVSSRCAPCSIEYNLAQNLLPLPVDQRYREKDMDVIVSHIVSFLHSI